MLELGAHSGEVGKLRHASISGYAIDLKEPLAADSRIL
jgi:hypothetical protein